MCNHPTLTRSKHILLLLVFLAAVFHGSAPLLPVTGDSSSPGAPVTQTDLPSLADFSNQLRTGNPDQVVGVYVESIMAFPVVSQPGDQPGYVSTVADVITRFAMAESYGSLGFLAHNYLAGAVFDELQTGNLVHVIYGDGHAALYEVRVIRRFQALDPLSLYSDFIDEENGIRLSVTDLFFQTYGVPGQLILQTCIAAGGSDSWGRLFVIATPAEPVILLHSVSSSQPFWWEYE